MHGLAILNVFPHIVSRATEFYKVNGHNFEHTINWKIFVMKNFLSMIASTKIKIDEFCLNSEIFANHYASLSKLPNFHHPFTGCCPKIITVDVELL